MAEDIELSFEDLTFQEDKTNTSTTSERDSDEKKHSETSFDQETEEELPNLVLISMPYGIVFPLADVIKVANTLCGKVKLYNFREKQAFAFFQFESSEGVEKALEKLIDHEIDGHKLQVEQISRITPGRDPRTHDWNSEYKNSTLVLKNLPFQLKQEKLEEILNQYPWKPQSVSYLYDGNGMFRGMAFVKYKEIEAGTKVFEQMNGMDIQGRKLRIEYKRKVKEADISSMLSSSYDSNANGTGTSLGSTTNSVTPGTSVENTDKLLEQQISSFKFSSSVNELAFPCLNSYQRRQIHQIAEKLGLGHYSTGEGESKYVLLKKKENKQQQQQLEKDKKKEEKDQHTNNNNKSDNSSESKGQPIKGRRRGDSSASGSTPSSLSGSHNNSARDRSGRSYGDGGKWGSPDKDSAHLSSTPSKMSKSFGKDNNRWNDGHGNSPAPSYGTSPGIAISRSPNASHPSSHGHSLNPPSGTSFGKESLLLSTSPSMMGTSPTYRKSAAILHRAESPLTGILRQPKGPDGTTGFSPEYRKSRSSTTGLAPIVSNITIS